MSEYPPHRPGVLRSFNISNINNKIQFSLIESMTK